MSDETQPTPVATPQTASSPYAPIVLDALVLVAVIVLGLRDKIPSEAIVGVISAIVTGRIMQAKAGAAPTGVIAALLAGGAALAAGRGATS